MEDKWITVILEQCSLILVLVHLKRNLELLECPVVRGESFQAHQRISSKKKIKTNFGTPSPKKASFGTPPKKASFGAGPAPKNPNFGMAPGAPKVPTVPEHTSNIDVNISKMDGEGAMCNVCGKAFTNVGNARRHYKTTHEVIYLGFFS